MANGRTNSLLRFLRRISVTVPDSGRTDGELLRLFVARRDETAFAALVQRHGPMVWGVCRRVLSDAHDADDAWQAVFLVLARKAPSLRRPELLGNWLYGVACRTAAKARGLAIRRRSREEPLVEDVPATAGDSDWRELRPLLDEELQRLPEKYRAPLVLCYLEGKTYVETAQTLGWAEGTVSGRLARAREMLRTRLVRRGVSIPAAALATILCADKLSAAVPPALVDAVVNATVLSAAGKTAGVVSANVLTLSQGVLRTMFLSRLMILTAVFLVVGTVGTTVGALVYRGPGKESVSPKSDETPKIVAKEKTREERIQEETAQFEGIWRRVAFTSAGDWTLTEKEIRMGRWAFSKGHFWSYTVDGLDGLTEEEALEKIKKRGNGGPYKYEIAPDQDPKAMDVYGDATEARDLRIYRFENGRLYICDGSENARFIRGLYHDDAGDRPKKFTGGHGKTLIVLERVKPADKVAKPKEKTREERIQEENAQFEGIWREVAFTSPGDWKLTDKEIRVRRWAFSKEHYWSYTVEGLEKSLTEEEALAKVKESGRHGAYKINLDKDPKAIDLYLVGAMEANARELGIYRFEKGQLVICEHHDFHGDDRPKEFKGSNGCSLIVLERVKPADKDDKPKQQLADKGTKPREVAKNLEGAWKVVSLYEQDKQVPDEELKKYKITITKDKFHRESSEKGIADEVIGVDGPFVVTKESEDFEFALHPEKDPPEFEFVLRPPSSRKIFLVSHGIYRVEKGRLTLCYTRDGQDRPKEFKEGKGVTLIVLEQVDP
jgi:RNA polymerase sigma factor (sigma-70 family)